MAYMDQAKKKIIKAEIDAAIAKHGKKVKYSLTVRNHMELSMAILQCEIDLMEEYRKLQNPNAEYFAVNHFFPKTWFTGKGLELIEDIIKAINCQNYDNSDSQRDYFDCGYYISLSVGKWDKPFNKI